MIYITDRSGAIIKRVNSVPEGKSLIETYEEDDKKLKVYTPDFYSLSEETWVYPDY